MKNKKRIPFKETGIFKVLKNVAPQVLDTVTDIAASVYPPFGIVNTMVDTALGFAKNDGDIALLESERISYDKDYKDYLLDIQDAREMYQSTEHEMADNIADNVIKRNLIFVAILVLIQVSVVIFIEDKTVIAVISSVIGGVVTALLQERQQVINFFFGSSKGSKDKDKQLR